MFFGDKGRSIIYKDIHQNVCIPSSITFDALLKQTCDLCKFFELFLWLGKVLEIDVNLIRV